MVSYNTRELTLECVEALKRSTCAEVLEIVVIDNASSDGTVDALRAAHPDITVIDSLFNLGFAAAVNEAAATTTSTLVALVNPDAQVEPNALAQLADEHRRHPSSVLGGRIRRSDGTIDSTTARRLPSVWTLFCSATGLGAALRRLGVDPDTPRGVTGDDALQVPVLSGALLLAPRTVWDTLGGLDRTYFLYSEDVDFCARAAELGSGCRLVPAAVAIHDSGASSTSTGKEILLLSGKCTYVRLRWSGPRRSAGLALLQFGVLVRKVAARGHRVDWSRVWATRSIWSAGYGPFGEDRSRFTTAANTSPR